MVIGLTPIAFAEIIEYKGENYTIETDTETGENIWSSHVNRIMVDGDWENYFLEVDDQKIMVRSNSIIGFVYDIPTCSFSLYENGFDGNVIIPSVSTVASYFKDGTWQNMAVNQESCDINLSEFDYGIIINATKTNDSETFQHDIIVDTRSGVKETFKIWNESDELLSVSQTVHTGEFITIGNNTINIAQFNNQSFDRTFLEQNEAQIFEIADKLMYDFDIGFDYLSNVNIFFDTDYKVNLDYANGNFTNYLEIDPTFTVSPAGNVYDTKIIDQSNNDVCGDTLSSGQVGEIWNETVLRIWLYPTWHSYDCTRIAMEFNTSSIPTGVIITDSDLTMYLNNYVSPRSCDIHALNNRPSSNVLGVWNEMNSNTNRMVQEANTCTGPNTQNYSYDLGTVGDSYFQNRLGSSWSGIGMKYHNEALDSANRKVEFRAKDYGSDPPTLTITYVNPPNPPTNLGITQTTANQLDLSWTAPSSGTAPTGYKIERSLDGTNWTVLTSNTGNTNTNYSDASLSANTLYYYRVSSVTSGSPSSPSNTASQTTWDYPEQVTGLSATDGDPISLSWSTPASDDTITGYKLYRDTNYIKTVTGTSTTDAPPNYGQTYSYTVSAVSNVGEGSQSTSVNAVRGVPPNPPTNVSTVINNPDPNPLDVTITWSSPTNVGTGTLTGFQIWRDGVLITTTGLVTSYTDTVPSSGTYSYEVKAVSTHGTSTASNSSSQTTPNVPNAISDLSATVDSDTQISLSWTVPNNGGSAITGYKVFQDGVQIATPTSASHVVTGLTSNTQYTFKVIAVNNAGDSADSNLVTPTTYQAVVGSINVSSTVQGATVKFDFSGNVTSGTPTPNFNTFTLKEGATVLASNISTPYYYALPDISSHTYTITSTDNTHWNTPTISGTTSNIVAGYVPSWENSVSYNYTRTSSTMNLFVNQDRQDLWDLTCNYRTTAQIIGNNNGVNGTMTNDWYYSDAQAISDADTVYVECTDATGVIVSFTSYNTNRIGAGIALLDNVFSEWTGTPVALIFVLLVAGLFSGRSAPAGILLVLAIVGVMGFIGLLVIDELIWAFILLAGILGLFMGKRFL